MGSFATSGVVSIDNSGVGSCVEILSKLFIENNLLLKLLRTFSLAFKNNPKLFTKTIFSNFFHYFIKILNSVGKLLCLL